MKSKPVYAPLKLDETARRHLFITQGIGEMAARRVLTERPYVAAQTVNLEAHWPVTELVQEALVQAGMDTAFYIAGPEVFVWQVTRTLREAGVEMRRIRQQVTGSLARTVYCVHCRAMNDGVTTSIHRCRQCGIALTVRDHFSRPLGAYMGVIAEAEVPGEIPEPEVLYP